MRRRRSTDNLAYALRARAPEMPRTAINSQREQAKGKVKEGLGKAAGNESLEAEGHADQAKGNLKQAGEKVKDAFKK